MIIHTFSHPKDYLLRQQTENELEYSFLFAAEFIHSIHCYRISSKLTSQLWINETQETKIQNSNLYVTFWFYYCLLRTGNGQVRLRQSPLIQPHPEHNASNASKIKILYNSTLRLFLLNIHNFSWLIWQSNPQHACSSQDKNQQTLSYFCHQHMNVFWKPVICMLLVSTLLSFRDLLGWQHEELWPLQK